MTPSYPSRPMASTSTVLLLLCCIFASAWTTSQQDEALTMDRFHRWMEQHGKSYATVDEKLRRFEVYRRNVEHIEATNREGKLSYTLGENQFTDLTDEEFLAKHTSRYVVLPPDMTSSNELEDYDETVITTRAGDVVEGHGGNLSTVPESVDWRAVGAVTPVKDQGECGSCWAFAAVAVVESLNQIKNGKLVDLSEQELVDCGQYDCIGGTSRGAIFWIWKNGGITTEADYPYMGKKGVCDKTKLGHHTVSVLSTGYVAMNNEQKLMEAVAKQPVTAVIEVAARVQFSFASAREEPRHLVPCFPKKMKTAPIKSMEGILMTYEMLGCDKFIKRADLEKSRHLVDDSFTVRCDIVVMNGFRAVEPAPAVPRAFVTVPPSDLDRCLRGLLESGNGADATFEVAGERFAAHRWLLAARSPAFSAELLERGGASDVVRVDKMDPRVFKALLSFMYTDSLSLPLPETTTKQEEAALAQHLLVAAHRYGMERLKLLCEESLCKTIDVGTAANILALAEPLGCRGLKEACFDFVGRSPANLKAVMASDGFQHLSATCPYVLKDLLALGSAPRPVQ